MKTFSPRQKAYFEKLKDPRWQKKRLAIFQRDGFVCQFCWNENATLHCHHMRYLPDREPWDYNDSYLVTLCEKCHKRETDERGAADDMLLEVFSVVKNCSAYNVEKFARFLSQAIQYHGLPDVVLEAMEFRLGFKPEMGFDFVQDYFQHLAKARQTTKELAPAE